MKLNAARPKNETPVRKIKMYEKCKENLVSEGKGSPTMDTARCFRSCKCMYLIRCSMLPRILTPLDIYFRIGINSTAMIGSPVHP